MPNVYLSEDICRRARAKMVELLEAQDSKGIIIQHRAAESLIRHCQTQERYALDGKTPADFARATKSPNSMAQQLDQLSDDDLRALQDTMVGGKYPGHTA